jgi:hypothetical protein
LRGGSRAGERHAHDYRHGERRAGENGTQKSTPIFVDPGERIIFIEFSIHLNTPL